MMRWLAAGVALGLSCLPVYAHAHGVRDCTPRHTVMVLDDGQGAFDGMMHGGMWLVVRNTGMRACTLASVGPISFEDGHHHAIPVRWQQAVAMPDGVLPPGGQARTALRWVSGNAFDPGYCITPATLVLSLHKGALRQSFGRSLCALSGTPPALEQQPWQAVPARQ
ncbi:hypothetical protein Geu3261_0068_008 [Komagataeibacter europaeus NBRC 3261]|uniref:DUF4232 domain-containing protein n=1 Tax=Komagataeibacter europaeus NBRC 3261 TaxID=1234669 RepID=A0A0D6PYX0_KOMEU|nr:DUF4232 domain-containing protein [Komagataeibacter europaeus]GAN96379.1 hypothetical protein Geu3261_0068_008 [Komagataeibacter europaeus NBRC 3261]